MSAKEGSNIDPGGECDSVDSSSKKEALTEQVSTSKETTPHATETAGNDDDGHVVEAALPTVVQKPKRPLSAYNIFFREQRAKIQQERKDLRDNVTEGSKDESSLANQSSVQFFASMGRLIGERWRKLPQPELDRLKRLAVIERESYAKAKKEYESQDTTTALFGSDDTDKKPEASNVAKSGKQKGRKRMKKSVSDKDESNADVGNAGQASMSQVASLGHAQAAANMTMGRPLVPEGQQNLHNMLAQRHTDSQQQMLSGHPGSTAEMPRRQNEYDPRHLSVRSIDRALLLSRTATEEQNLRQPYQQAMSMHQQQSLQARIAQNELEQRMLSNHQFTTSRSLLEQSLLNVPPARPELSNYDRSRLYAGIDLFSNANVQRGPGNSISDALRRQSSRNHSLSGAYSDPARLPLNNAQDPLRGSSGNSSHIQNYLLNQRRRESSDQAIQAANLAVNTERLIRSSVLSNTTGSRVSAAELEHLQRLSELRRLQEYSTEPFVSLHPPNLLQHQLAMQQQLQFEQQRQQLTESDLLTHQMLALARRNRESSEQKSSDYDERLMSSPKSKRDGKDNVSK